jgi:CheY-like chemotaxis protein
LPTPSSFEQVVANLLSNAVKFTSEGGRVEVHLERTRSEARIAVRDTGIGIPQHLLPRIFDRFRWGDSAITRRHGGLGLGLAIVRHLVELHGGTVSAESPGEERGAEFTVTLPLEADPLLPAGPRGERRAGGTGMTADLRGVRVLVVDDDSDVLSFMQTLFRAHGAEVTTARSAREALAALERTPADVLVSDIAMPDADGYTLLREVCALTPAEQQRLPAIAVTAHANAGHVWVQAPMGTRQCAHAN